MKSVFVKKGVVNDTEMTTQELIKLCLNNPPSGGFQYKDFKERARVENAMDHLQQVEGEEYECFILEDADYKNLVKWIQAMQWLTRAQFVIDFCEQFLN